MLTLLIDTSHRLLCVGLADEKGVFASLQENLAKKQSEYLLVSIDKLIKEHGLAVLDIERIIVTDGPGSYTGLRIGLTFVKTYVLVNPDVAVYVIDTLLSISGGANGFAFIDARSQRVYGAYVDQGLAHQQRIYTLDELAGIEGPFYGDLSLLGGIDGYGDVIETMYQYQSAWRRVIEIDRLLPRYLR